MSKIAEIMDVAEALKTLDITPEIVNVADKGEPANYGINVRMADPHARVADDTIWPPTGNDGWVWGDRFQFNLAQGATAMEVAKAVSNTVQARA